jgi:hypothetical protein
MRGCILQHVSAKFTPLALAVACLPILAVETLGADVPAADVVVVRPQAWSDAMKPWRAYREQQGYAVAEVDAELGRDAIRAAIRSIAASSGGALRYVLLAGDVSSPAMPHGINPFYHRSTALIQFGGDAVIASDNDYGDLSGDHSPELAVGRIPAKTASQLAAALDRSMAFEQLADFSSWRRNVHVVAGVGGFGAVADSVIELTTRRFLSERIPGWSQLTMTQASLASCYCPDPLKFGDNCVERLNEGGMFWVYIGHGHVKTLDYLRVDERWLPILDETHLPAIQAQQRPPIAVFLACYTGAFDAEEDSLAERMVLSSTGPIAAIAATRVSGPYGLAMLSDGMLSQCFDSQAATLGEVFRNAKQGLIRPSESSVEGTERASQLTMLNALADALSPDDYSLEAERREHVWQVTLLGDPLLRLAHPQHLDIDIPRVVMAGEEVQIQGTTVRPGMLRVELANCRGRLPSSLQAMSVTHATQAGRSKYQSRYTAANQPVIVAEERRCDSGPFQCVLQVPDDLEPGKYCVRVLQESADGWSVGYGELRVRKQRD